MISGSTTISTAPRRWQQELALAYTRLDQLLAALDLDAARCGVSPAAAARFALRVPRRYVAAMRRGDPLDPLLLQVLPVMAEDAATPGYVADPVGDLASIATRGLLRKYAGRALLITTAACAVHCRYCFRREFPYGDLALRPATEHDALAHVAADPGIHELILSGGDPLALGDERLAGLVTAAAHIPHLRRLRIHSRMPTMLPERIDDGLIALLSASRLPVVVVTHVNHPRELHEDAVQALRRLAPVCHGLFNQSVLLRRINDSAETLAGLSESLMASRVVPYYLHQLDVVAGAAHFAVDDHRALQLMAALRQRLPGYLVPRLVREVAGHDAKVPLY